MQFLNNIFMAQSKKVLGEHILTLSRQIIVIKLSCLNTICALTTHILQLTFVLMKVLTENTEQQKQVDK